MKIKSIEITGMRKVANAKYDLSNVNYIVGMNGSGKSTILNAIQLALLGYIPGQAKTNAAVMQNSKSKVLSVTAVLDDVTITRTWTKKGSSVQSSVDITPEGYDISQLTDQLELPVFNFSELLSMSTNKQKEYFIELLPKSESSIDIKERLDAASKELGIPDEYIKDVTSKMFTYFDTIKELPPVDAMKKLNDWVKQELSATKVKLDRDSKTIQNLVFYNDVDPELTEEECTEQLKSLNSALSDLKLYRSQLAAHTNWQNSMKAFEDVKDTYDGVESADHIPEYKKAKENKEAAYADLSKIQTKVKGLQDEITKINGKILAKQAAIKADNSVIVSGGVCQYTGNVCEAIKDMIDNLSKNVEAAKEEVSTLESQKKDINSKIEDINAKSVYLNATINEADKTMNTLSNNLNRYQMLIQSEPELITPKTKNEDIITSDIGKYTDLLGKIKANNQYNQLIDQLTKEKALSEFQIILYKEMSKVTGANGLQSELSNLSFIEFASKIDVYLKKFFSEDVNASFNLESAANSFSFGVTSNDVYVPYQCLSSGEKCIYFISFVAALLDNMNCPLKVIMVDDMLDHLDDKNASGVFNAIANEKDIQVIFAGVKSCDSKDINIIEP